MPWGDAEKLVVQRRMLRSLVIYDIVEHIIHGALPVYLIGAPPHYLLSVEEIAEIVGGGIQYR